MAFAIAVILIFCVFQAYGSPNVSEKPPETLNTCLSATRHKILPTSTAEKLPGECAPWTNRSCCTAERAKQILDEDVYQLKNLFCGPLTQKCLVHMRKEACFFECSPNVGLWTLHPFNKSSEYQTYKNVPLCRSDCNDWYNACSDDSTCMASLGRGYTHEKNCTNITNSSSCKKISVLFKTAKDFCEKIWDNSYKVEDQHCMKMTFDASEGNPNNEVAYYYEKNNPNSAPSLTSSLVYLLVILHCIFSQKCLFIM